MEKRLSAAPANSSSHGNNYRERFRSQPHFSSEKLKNYEKAGWDSSCEREFALSVSPFSSKPVFCKQKIAKKHSMYETHQKITIRDLLVKIHSLKKYRYVNFQPDEANQARRIEALDFKWRPKPHR